MTKIINTIIKELDKCELRTLKLIYIMLGEMIKYKQELKKFGKKE